MADSVDIQDGDLVLVRRGGVYVAWVQRAGARHVVVEPCDRSIRDRRVRVDDIVAVYRRVGSPAQPRDGRLKPSPRQLRLEDIERHGTQAGPRSVGRGRTVPASAVAPNDDPER